MKKALIGLLLLFWPLTSYAWVGKVVNVIDGDTIKVYNAELGQVEVRFYGIDAPEKGQAFGWAAGRQLASLIAGATVEIETVTKDDYDRTVGLVWNRGENINEHMVADGYAWVYRKYCGREFCNEWLELEGKARNAGIGLWQQPNPIRPSDWRRAKRR